MNVSVAALIYKSTVYADSVYNSFAENTDDAEFFFVANDASPEVLRHLEKMKYPFIDHRNKPRTEKELESIGIEPPLYLHYVYNAWNRAIEEARQPYVALVNSDHRFARGWLDALLGHARHDRAVVSHAVEPGRREVFPGCVQADFGQHPDEFREEEFQEFAMKLRKPGTRPGGVYMPALLCRKTILDLGGYPPGNPAGTYGDQRLFDQLEHITCLDSIVYHFKEGEMVE